MLRPGKATLGSRGLLLCVVAVMALATAGQAETIRVPSGQPTIPGAHTNPDSGPVVTSIGVGPGFIGRLTDHTPVIFWAYTDDNPGSQTRYEIQVGTDEDWTVAEMWSPGVVNSADTFAVYSGAPLEDGEPYELRLRLGNATSFGQWFDQDFRMNMPPEVPSLNTPIGGETVAITGVAFAVTNTRESQFDDLTNDFEVFSDQDLTTMVASVYGVEELPGVTYSPLIEGLSPNTSYWWRSRAHDGYEYSEWSETESFFVRPALSFRVPQDYPTIQMAVHAAQEGDTVLLLPGVHAGPGNVDIMLDGKGLVITSESGPATTVIDCEGTGRALLLRGRFSFDPVIDGLTIANGNGGESGGAVQCHGCSPIIRRCVFIGNTAYRGGAIYSDEYVDGTWYDAVLNVENCTFVNNHADDRGSVSFSESSMTVVFNLSTISSNTCDRRGPVDMSFSYGYVQLYCCNIYGNSPGDWIGGISSRYGNDGNISVHPMMCDVDNGQYGIHAESPLRAEVSPCGELVGALGVLCDDCYDIDEDSWCAAEDNCPTLPNTGQEDQNGDGIGDVCEDWDGDIILNGSDNCPDVANYDQADRDSDGIGDVCDDDMDGDGHPNDNDNCPRTYNPEQLDDNSDGVGNACCCVGYTGDADGSGGEPTIGDISALIDAKFITGTCDGIIECIREADINQSGGCEPVCADITIGDITALVFCMFHAACDPWNTPPCLDCP